MSHWSSVFYSLAYVVTLCVSGDIYHPSGRLHVNILAVTYKMTLINDERGIYIQTSVNTHGVCNMLLIDVGWAERLLCLSNSFLGIHGVLDTYRPSLIWASFICTCFHVDDFYCCALIHTYFHLHTCERLRCFNGDWCPWYVRTFTYKGLSLAWAIVSLICTYLHL